MSTRYTINMGAGNTGLSLSFSQFIRLDNNTATTAPSIFEIASSDGDYYFDYEWATAPSGVTDIWFRVEAASVKIADTISVSDQYQYADIVAINAKTTNLPSDPASQSAIKGVSNKDLSQVDSDVQTVISNLASAVTNIKGSGNKDLTQVDTDVTSGTSTTATNITNAQTSIKGSGNKDLTQVDADVQTVISNLAADTASIKGINNKDLSQVDSDVQTVISNLASAVTNIKGSGNKDLTQVDTDVQTNGTSIAALTAIAQRILALSYSNLAEDSQSYDANSHLLSSTLWFYDTAAHATSNDHVTGLLYKYTIAVTYDVNGNCNSFKMTQVL